MTPSKCPIVSVIIWRLRPLIFSRIDAALVTGVLGFDRLGTNNGIGGVSPLAVSTPTLLVERVEGLLPHAALIEAAKMIVDCVPRGKLFGRHAPLNPALDHV